MRPRILDFIPYIACVLLAPLIAGCVPDPPATSVDRTQRNWIAVQIGSSETDGGMRASVIYFVLPGGPADKAGLQEGDRVLSIGGKPTTSSAEFTAALRDVQPNATVPIVLVRQAQRSEIQVRVDTRPPEADITRRWQEYLVQREQQELRAAGDAEQAGERQSAFGHYVRAARAGYHSTVGPDSTLERLAAFLQRQRIAPPVPMEAERHNQRAMAILQQATGDADTDRAVREMNAATFAAPWVADLHLNDGLVKARAGYSAAAATAMRRYLLFNPRANDATAVRQKIVDLELVAEEHAPWKPFLREWPQSRGGTIILSLRGRTLNALVSSPQPGTDQKPGDTLCRGTIQGTTFAGHCTMWMPSDAAKACFGAKREYEADGGIVGNDLKLMTTTDLNFGTSTCIINSETRGTLVWLSGRTGAI